jgi:hypothetical protein
MQSLFLKSYMYHFLEGEATKKGPVNFTGPFWLDYITDALLTTGPVP